MKVLKGIKDVFLLLITIAAVCGMIYGSYWAAKTISYSFFYEDMVERTVVKLVKPEYLK